MLGIRQFSCIRCVKVWMMTELVWMYFVQRHDVQHIIEDISLSKCSFNITETVTFINMRKLFRLANKCLIMAMECAKSRLDFQLCINIFICFIVRRS